MCIRESPIIFPIHHLLPPCLGTPTFLTFTRLPVAFLHSAGCSNAWKIVYGDIVCALPGAILQQWNCCPNVHSSLILDKIGPLKNKSNTKTEDKIYAYPVGTAASVLKSCIELSPKSCWYSQRRGDLKAHDGGQKEIESFSRVSLVGHLACVQGVNHHSAITE